jgi:hypothetical protein
VAKTLVLASSVVVRIWVDPGAVAIVVPVDARRLMALELPLIVVERTFFVIREVLIWVGLVLKLGHKISEAHIKYF